MTQSTIDLARETLSSAGIHINGSDPWDIQVNDPRFYDKVVAEGSIGLGESYMDGWWDCAALDQMFERLIKSKAYDHSKHHLSTLLGYLHARLFNLQSKKRSKVVGKKHYDAGNDLFQVMLDSQMTYSCGYWKNARNLEEAQRAKLDLVCRKIDLQPGMRVLDIGCGWGSFCCFAAEHYDVQIVGITISEKQLAFAKERCRGLSVDLRFQDYRDIHEKFDRIVSIGQFEHVGYKNYPNFFEICNESLQQDGLMLLHTIGSNYSTHRGDPWIEKYIFPGGALPSISQIGSAIEHLFVMEDWHNFGMDYSKTLLAWNENFKRHWSEISNHYDERFFRMWTYYLLLCAGCFKARYLQLWQVVLSPEGIKGGYRSIR